MKINFWRDILISNGIGLLATVVVGFVLAVIPIPRMSPLLLHCSCLIIGALTQIGTAQLAFRWLDKRWWKKNFPNG